MLLSPAIAIRSASLVQEEQTISERFIDDETLSIIFGRFCPFSPSEISIYDLITEYVCTFNVKD